MCGQGDVAGRCCNDIPAGLRGKYRQAIAAREWSMGSSTSIGEEDRKSKTLEAEALEKKGGEGALPSRKESGMNGHGRGGRDREP